MKKYIKYSVDGLNIFITEQSHRCEDFSEGESGDPSEFIASNGIRLCSYYAPERSEYYTFVRGKDESSDNTPISCEDLADLNKVTAAINEYNAAFSDGKAPLSDDP